MQTLEYIGQKVPVLKKLLEENHNLRTDKGVLQLEKGQLEADVRQLELRAGDPRTFFAYQFIKGSGVEIGAAQHPLKLPSKTKVKYVDVFTADELRKAFPTAYANVDVVDVDIVDDAENLDKFKPNSLDFIIANHFIEHCLDPLGTVINMYSKLRNRGVLYMAIPDKRYTFDKYRPVTAYEHLLEERKDKTKSKFRKEHTEEAVRLDKEYAKLKDYSGDVDKEVQRILDSDFRIHYHVWTQKEMTEMFGRVAHDFKINLEIEALIKNHHEVIYVLRKEPNKPLTE